MMNFKLNTILKGDSFYLTKLRSCGRWTGLGNWNWGTASQSWSVKDLYAVFESIYPFYKLFTEFPRCIISSQSQVVIWDPLMPADVLSQSPGHSRLTNMPPWRPTIHFLTSWQRCSELQLRLEPVAAGKHRKQEQTTMDDVTEDILRSEALKKTEIKASKFL